MGERFSITKQRGQWFDGPSGIPVIATFHPAYILRQTGGAMTEVKKLVCADLKQSPRAAAASRFPTPRAAARAAHALRVGTAALTPTPINLIFPLEQSPIGNSRIGVTIDRPHRLCSGGRFHAPYPCCGMPIARRLPARPIPGVAGPGAAAPRDRPRPRGPTEEPHHLRRRRPHRGPGRHAQSGRPVHRLRADRRSVRQAACRRPRRRCSAARTGSRPSCSATS